MMKTPIIMKELNRGLGSMDWFLYDRRLHNERVKQRYLSLSSKITEVELGNGIVGEGVHDLPSSASSTISDDISLLGLLISCHLNDSKI